MSTVEKKVMIKLPKLRASRRAKEFKGQGELAKKAGVSSYAVAVAELGRAINIIDAEKIAVTLGVKLQSLRS